MRLSKLSERGWKPRLPLFFCIIQANAYYLFQIGSFEPRIFLKTALPAAEKVIVGLYVGSHDMYRIRVALVISLVKKGVCCVKMCTPVCVGY